MKSSLIKTEAQLKAMSNAQLVETYNAVAEECGYKTVNRFSDQKTGVKRCLDVFEQYAANHRPIVSKAQPAAKSTPAPAAKKTAPAPAPAAKKAAANGAASRPRRGTNLIPLGHEPQACREGSKQAMLLDMLRRPKGATMPELIEALSGGNKPWTEATVRSGFGWDLKNKGYGVRSEFAADGTERFHLVLPAKYQTIPAHTPLKSAKPKADARQQKLV